MNNTEHTRDPWYIIVDDQTDEYNVMALNNVDYEYHYAVCHCYGPNDLMNARLIAAAPELLDALEDIIFARETDYMGTERAYDKAKKIIAKAKGL